VATLDARTTQLGDDLQRLDIMLDRLVLMYLLHTAEVPPGLQPGAFTSAKRRYANYRKFVSEQLAKVDHDGTENASGAAGDKE